MSEDTPSEGTPPAEDTSLLGDNPPADPPADPPKAEDPPADPAPEPLTLDAFKAELPDGTEIDDAIAGEFLEIVNGAESPMAMATQLFGLQNKIETEAVQGMVDEWNTMQTAWRDEVRNDPEVGGANMEANLATAKELIKNWAPDPEAFQSLLTSTGVGNSVHMVKFLLAIDKAIPKEGQPVQGQQTSTPKSLADRLFAT